MPRKKNCMSDFASHCKKIIFLDKFILIAVKLFLYKKKLSYRINTIFRLMNLPSTLNLIVAYVKIRTSSCKAKGTIFQTLYRVLNYYKKKTPHSQLKSRVWKRIQKGQINYTSFHLSWILTASRAELNLL